MENVYDEDGALGELLQPIADVLGATITKSGVRLAVTNWKVLPVVPDVFGEQKYKYNSEAFYFINGDKGVCVMFPAVGDLCIAILYSKVVDSMWLMLIDGDILLAQNGAKGKAIQSDVAACIFEDVMDKSRNLVTFQEVLGDALKKTFRKGKHERKWSTHK